MNDDGMMKEECSLEETTRSPEAWMIVMGSEEDEWGNENEGATTHNGGEPQIVGYASSQESAEGMMEKMEERYGVDRGELEVRPLIMDELFYPFND